MLEQQYRFQIFFEQAALLAEKHDAELRLGIREKSTLAFLKQLDAYAEHVDQTCFAAREVRVGRRIVPDWFIDEAFRKHRGTPMKERLVLLLKAIEHNVGIYFNMGVMPEQRAEIRAALKTIRWSNRPACARPTGTSSTGSAGRNCSSRRRTRSSSTPTCSR